MNRELKKKITWNNGIFVLLMTGFMLLTLTGIFDSLVSGIGPINEDFFLFSQLSILLVYTLIIFVRCDIEIEFKELFNYFFLSLVFLVLLILFFVYSLAGMSFIVIFLVMISLIIYSSILSFVKVIFSKLKKKFKG